MRRLVSVPAAVLLSLLLTSTVFAAFCGNDSKQEDAGQHTTYIVNLAASPPTVTFLEGGNPTGNVTGGFVDVWLDFNGDGIGDCFIDDTFVLSEHELFHVAPGQDFEMLAVNPAVHRGRHPDGDPGTDGTGVGFAATDC